MVVGMTIINRSLILACGGNEFITQNFLTTFIFFSDDSVYLYYVRTF